MSRRHALAVEVGAVLVALSVALVMLAHATAAGAGQWAAGAVLGVTVALIVGMFIVIVVLAENAGDVPAAVRRRWRAWRVKWATKRQAAELRRQRAARRHAGTGGRR